MLFPSPVSALPDRMTAYRDVLHFEGTPKNRDEGGISIFSDLGAWQGYSLPGDENNRGGFCGPLLLTDDHWLSPSLALARPQIDGTPFDFSSATGGGTSLPGRLSQTWTSNGIELKVDLIFVSKQTALTIAHVTNLGKKDVGAKIDWAGSTFDGQTLHPIQNGTTVAMDGAKFTQLFSDPVAIDVLPSKELQVESLRSVRLRPGASIHSAVAQSLVYDGQPSDDQKSILSAASSELKENEARWNGYVKCIERPTLDLPHRRLGVKAIETLVNNWRSALQGLKHDGCYPSYLSFQGFWPWDSWKQAVALVKFAPGLAEDQIRAVFDYQTIDGMPPDVVMLNPAGNNNRNTKPPLGAWATWHVFQVTKDKAFAREMLPKLVKFHRWWYAFRSHLQDGFCQYGSTDGTRVAAGWESGMDNAVRFDNATMVKNSDGAFSLDQSSVDLNSFLVLDKRCLARLYHSIGEDQQAKKWDLEADQLAFQIQNRFFYAMDGFFHDRRFDGFFVSGSGSEGWSPLWTGVATPIQAKSVRNAMMDPKRFFTKLPLPTLSADDPKFAPSDGYWRGPVWLDQVYFGIRGLQRYGFNDDAQKIEDAMFQNAEGLLTDLPIHETYDPLTGQAKTAQHFGWSAAHILMLLTDSPRNEP